MFQTVSAQVGALIMVAVCLFTAAGGRWPERLMAGAVAIAWIGSAALQDRQNLIDPQYAIFALDVLAAAFFTWMAVKGRSGWIIAVAAFQWLTAATHIAVMIDLRIFVRAYLTAYLVWSYALLIALAWGGVAAWRARLEERSPRHRVP